MGARRKFTAEYKREAVAMVEAPGVTVSQIAADLGIGANVLGRWCRPSDLLRYASVPMWTVRWVHHGRLARPTVRRIRRPLRHPATL